MKPYSIDLRMRVIDAYNRHEGSIRTLAKRFAIHWRTVSNWIMRFNKEQSAGPRIQRHGPLPKLDEEGVKVLERLVEAKPDATLSELAKQVNSITGIMVSPSNLCRALQKSDLTVKKKTPSASEANKPEVWKAFGEFAEAVAHIHIDDMVFVDETGINLGMTRRYGRSPRGERLVGSAPFSRGQNVSVIGALSTEGMVNELMVQGGVDELTFRVFVKDYLIPELLPGQVVIMDNLRVHKDLEIEQLIVRAGASLIYLPPYSPELDPIENAWSKFKEKLRSAAARTYEALVEAVRDAAMSITSKDARGWFAHCGYEEQCNTPT